MPLSRAGVTGARMRMREQRAKKKKNLVKRLRKFTDLRLRRLGISKQGTGAEETWK